MAQIIAFITRHTGAIIWVLMAVLVVTQALVIQDKKNQIAELQNTVDVSRDALRRCNGSFEVLKATSADEKKKSRNNNTKKKK